MNLIFKKETHQYFINEEEKISVSKILNNYLGSNYNKIPKAILLPAIIRDNAIHKVANLYFKNINDENVIEKIKLKIKTIPVFTEKILEYCNKKLLINLQSTNLENTTIQFFKLCKKHQLDFNNKVQEIQEYYENKNMI